jgi:hemoglobin/transferrin/lactoferrin receptor protein
MNDLNKISFNLSSGFRSPNIDDIGKIRENAGVLSVPNMNLKPEYVYTLDLGWSKFNKKFRTNLNIYYTILNGSIGRDYFKNETETILFDEEFVQMMANFNLGNSNVYGGNFDFKANLFDNIVVDGSLTYTKGSSFRDILPMPSIPPIFGFLKIKLIKEKSQLQLSYRFSGSKNPETYSMGGEDGLDETPLILNEIGETEYAGMPSWGVFQLSSLFKTRLFKRPIDIKFILDNIFDIHYREFASGISSPGRSLNLVVNFN